MKFEILCIICNNKIIFCNSDIKTKIRYETSMGKKTTKKYASYITKIKSIICPICGRDVIIYSNTEVVP